MNVSWTWMRWLSGAFLRGPREAMVWVLWPWMLLASSRSRARGAPCGAVWEGVQRCHFEKWWKRMCSPDCAKWQHMWEDQLSLQHVGDVLICSGLQFFTALPKADRRKNQQPVRKSKREINIQKCTYLTFLLCFSVGLASGLVVFALAQRAQIALSRMSVSSSYLSLTRTSQGWCLSSFSKVFRMFPVLHNVVALPILAPNPKQYHQMWMDSWGLWWLPMAVAKLP